MKNDRVWYALQMGLVVFWLIVPLVGLLGYTVPMLTLIALLILAAHVLEIPLAINMLKDQDIPKGKIILNTLVFGFTWWLPVSKGLIPK
ncbi:MAG: hypothetical protein R3194_02640 [Limnobacter sp.]|nr:hypothetical protein [Limnobacter sp.]